jgi:hypothetical protein
VQPYLRPIRGFGWIGLAGLPVVAFLLYCLVGGYDLRYALFALIERFWGIDAVFNTVIRQLLFGAYWPSLTGILVSPITLLWILIVMFLVPRRWAWWQWVLICLWMLTNPPLMLYLARWGSTLPAALRDLLLIPVRAAMHAPEAPLLIVIQHTAFCWLLWRMLRISHAHLPRMATIAPLTIFILGLMLGTLQHWLNLSTTQTTFTISINAWIAIGILWHTTCAALGIWAAIAVRPAARTSHHCAHCGYDIHGLAAPTCPECGNAINTDHAFAQSTATSAASISPTNAAPTDSTTSA